MRYVLIEQNEQQIFTKPERREIIMQNLNLSCTQEIHTRYIYTTSGYPTTNYRFPDFRLYSFWLTLRHFKNLRSHPKMREFLTSAMRQNTYSFNLTQSNGRLSPYMNKLYRDFVVAPLASLVACFSILLPPWFQSTCLENASSTFKLIV